MGIDIQLLQKLSDGNFCSGEALAQQLGVSRTTVWKEVARLEEQYGVRIQSVRGRGYRLSQAVELLDKASILANISQSIHSELSGIEILPVVDSTNRYLLAASSQGAKSGLVILAEQQTAGKGRQGRQWVSPFGCNIYCSLLWRSELAMTALSGMGIVVAVAVEKALSRYCTDLQIKWPNDILHNGQKLAGILLEMQGEAHGPASLVIGIGVNVSMPSHYGQAIDQAWTDLVQASGKLVSRNELSGVLIEQLISSLRVFEEQGLKGFVHEWKLKDMLLDKSVEMNLGSHQYRGIARGIDKQGALQLEINGELKSFMAGDASIRKCMRNE